MELDINWLWNVIRQRIRLISLMTSVSVALTGYVSFAWIPPRYEATATLLVQPQSTGSQIDYNDVVTNEKLVQTYGEIITSRRIARSVIERLDLPVTEQELLKRVRAKGLNDSLVTAVSAVGASPQEAVNIANGFALSFRENLTSIMKVDNVSILDMAETSSSDTPISPKPYLYMAIAFLVVFQLSVGIAVLLELSNKTLRTEEEVEEVLGLPIMGTISRFPEKTIKVKPPHPIQRATES